MNGFIVIDKPAGITSRDAVNQVQRVLPRRTKIGHTGTLDPLATGVLVLAIGEACKLAEKVQAMAKTYETRIRFGACSDSDDADGEITESVVTAIPAREAIDTLMPAFTGVILQLPPKVSALKVGGRRAHDLMRRGAEFELQPRPVHVHAVELLCYEWPWLDLRIDCGKGTYIRSIARDLGASLGVGGLVQTLRRTRVGPFQASQGLILPVTAEQIKNELILMNTLATGSGIGDNQ